MTAVHQMLMGSGGSFAFKVAISANLLNYNLKARALAAGWDGVRPLKADVTVNAGVVVGSANTASYAFETGTGFPAGTRISLTNNGYIVGAGGAGYDYYAHQYGFSGGPALAAQFPIVITNLGVIGGGGGGGSGPSAPDNGVGGGGGAGSVPGAGGAAYWQYTSGGNGSSGTLTTGGAGGICYIDGELASGPAGAGGSLGSPGIRVNKGSAAGAAGACTSGNANITWLATGTRYGALG